MEPSSETSHLIEIFTEHVDMPQDISFFVYRSRKDSTSDRYISLLKVKHFPSYGFFDGRILIRGVSGGPTYPIEVYSHMESIKDWLYELEISEISL